MSGIEKRALQVVVAIGCLVPIGAGTAGVIFGPRMLDSGLIGSADLDSHFHYLSGLRLAIGLSHHRFAWVRLAGVVVVFLPAAGAASPFGCGRAEVD